MRIETTTMHGFPDMIGVAPRLDTVFIEAKVAVGNKVKLSPHQISTNIKLWNETGGCNYILVYKEHAKPSPLATINLYEGRFYARSLTKRCKRTANEGRLGYYI